MILDSGGGEHAVSVHLDGVVGEADCPPIPSIPARMESFRLRSWVKHGLSFNDIHTGSFPGGEDRGYLESGSPFAASDCVRVLRNRNRP